VAEDGKIVSVALGSIFDSGTECFCGSIVLSSEPGATAPNAVSGRAHQMPPVLLFQATRIPETDLGAARRPRCLVLWNDPPDRAHSLSAE
jgi:hypothetical protein